MTGMLLQVEIPVVHELSVFWRQIFILPQLPPCATLHMRGLRYLTNSMRDAIWREVLLKNGIWCNVSSKFLISWKQSPWKLLSCSISQALYAWHSEENIKPGLGRGYRFCYTQKLQSSTAQTPSPGGNYATPALTLTVKFARDFTRFQQMSFTMTLDMPLLN